MDKLMRDEPPRRVRKQCSSSYSTSLLGGQLAPSAGDRTAEASIKLPAHVFSACLPWQDSEKDERSNLLFNVQGRVRSLSDDKRLIFLKHIHDHTSKVTKLSRSILHEALLAAELRVGSADADLLWGLYLKWARAGGRELSCASVAMWLGIELPPSLASAPTPTPAEEVAPRAVEGRGEEEICADWVVVEPADAEVHKEAAHMVPEPEPEPLPAPQTGVDERTKLAITTLQAMRATLALLFRQLPAANTTSFESPDQKTVKCSDLAIALTQHPLSLQLSPEDAWRLSCDLAGAPYSNTEAEAAFGDACRFLDDFDSGSSSKSARERQLCTSIKRKLQSSKVVEGDKIRLFALTTILRSRHRQQLQKGAATSSWQGVADECSLGEFATLLRGIDVHLTAQEAQLIGAQTFERERPRDVYFADGVKIGDAVLYLGNTLM